MSSRQDVRLSLLGGFGVTLGGVRVNLPPGSQRLVALLAVRGAPVGRTTIAGILWPEFDAECANRCLRTTLWRTRGVMKSLVLAGSDGLELGTGVAIDVHEASTLARRLIDADPDRSPPSPQAARALSLELLPGWCEDWLVLEAEAWRQLRLHALEALARRFTALGRYGDAAVAASTAVSGEPLRETAREVLIQVHLAEGNLAEAAREFDRFRALLDDELAVPPSPRLQSLFR